MFNKMRFPFVLVGIIAFCFFGWIASSIYSYFSYSVPPKFSLSGIEADSAFAKELKFTVCGDSSYKVGQIGVLIDGKEVELSTPKKVGAKKFEVPVSTDITTYSDGMHKLEVYAVDSSFNKNRSSQLAEFCVDNSPLRAAFIESYYKVDQGKTLHVKIQSNKRLSKAEVEFASAKYECFSDSKGSTTYECFIPIEAETSAGEYALTANLDDLVGNNLKLSAQAQVIEFQFPHQHGFTVKKEKLEEEKEVSASAKVLDEALVRWLEQSPKEKLWHGPFEFPVNVKRITTPFGEIRMTPELGRYIHRGVDLIDNPKAVVWAAQVGRVIIKDRFLISGNTVALDHGCGVFTLYFHLDSFADINVGDLVKKGNPIGKLGMTGYANGFHLHWELRVRNISVDPLEWTKTVY
jgi:murein DD-endopeptidase MepM/ murein hydrolase activator NlpD